MKNDRYKWTNEIHEKMFTELKSRLGVYKVWSAVMQPHNGTGQADQYLNSLEEVGAVLGKAFPAHDYTAVQVRQQINFALQQGIRAKGYNHDKPSHHKSALRVLNEAISTGFMVKEDIHGSFFGLLSQEVGPETPELSKLRSWFRANKTHTPANYTADLTDYLAYSRKLQDWDWSQVDIILRRLDRVLTLSKKNYSKAELKSARDLQDILKQFRAGERELEMILPDHVIRFIQTRAVELVDFNQKSLKETIPERGIDAPCLGTWEDMIARTVEGHNGNHRWKAALDLIAKGILPPDFKMPFMLMTMKEARDCHAAFDMIKDMANIQSVQAGSDISDVTVSAEKLIKVECLGPSLLTVDLSKNTLTGKKHPAVVKVRERMIDSHGGGAHTQALIIRTVYNAIRKLQFEKANSDGKIEHRSKEKMYEELDEYIGWKVIKGTKATFTHPGVGAFAGYFGPLGSEWKTALIDNHSGTTENTYFLAQPLDAKLNGQKLLHIMRDTKHQGDIDKIAENIKKKFNLYRTFNDKVRTGIHNDAEMLLPDMIAVPNYLTEDCEFMLRGKKVKVKSNTESFIFIERSALQQWIISGETELPLNWIFRLA